MAAKAQSKAMQRLSTGLSINSAADDAAGLAISNRMTSNINGLGKAIKNANDGINMAQTADSALSNTTSILPNVFKRPSLSVLPKDSCTLANYLSN